MGREAALTKFYRIGVKRSRPTFWFHASLKRTGQRSPYVARFTRSYLLLSKRLSSPYSLETKTYPPETLMISEVLKKLLPGVKENVSLADYTTFKIGGPADFFYTAKTEKDLLGAIRAARHSGIPFFILGRGSNVLFDDEGFRGLVVRNLVSGLKIVRRFKPRHAAFAKSDAHYHPADEKKYLQFADLDYVQEPFDTEVEVFSGNSLQHLVQWSLENNLTGLQWFAGIPGSVGGGVVYNVHGGTKLLADYLKNITLIDSAGRRKKIRLEKNREQKKSFAYDQSFLQKEKSVILKITLWLSHGDVARARQVYQEWWQRKLKVQPQTRVAGSIFRNFSLNTAKKAGAPTGSAGWFIDQCGFKGERVGGVQVSEKHANFFVNLGGATANDVKKLISLVKKSVKKRFGVTLREEILILGPGEKVF